MATEERVLGTVKMSAADVKKAAELQNWYNNQPEWFVLDSEEYENQVHTSLQSFLPESINDVAACNAWEFNSYHITPTPDMSETVRILMTSVNGAYDEAWVEVEIVG